MIEEFGSTEAVPAEKRCDHPTLSRAASGCFAGMFNGCKSRGVIFKPEEDHLFIGKSECEENWRKTWGELKALGFIDWREEDVPCFDGSKMIHVHLTITDKGYAWRKEDLRRWQSEAPR